MRRLLPVLILLILAGAAYGDDCITSGYVFFHNGSAVPAGTPVRLTNLDRAGADYNVVTYTFLGVPNYYLQVVFCVQSAGDRIRVYSNSSPWSKTVQTNSVAGVSQYRVNLTYDNLVPVWNASLPAQTVTEDTLTTRYNAMNLSNYCLDYDGQPLTYSIYTQSAPTLIQAVLNGTLININPPAANTSGSSTVCVRAHDTEDYSVQQCFTITVPDDPDSPAFNSAADNFSGIIIAEDRTMVISTSAFDGDGEQVRLYVCNTPSVTSGGCAGTELCTALSTTNPSCSFSTTSTEGPAAWYAYIYDTAGYIAPQNYSDNYTIDSQAPSPGTVVINDDYNYSSSTVVLLNWTGFSDTVSGIRYYYWSTVNGQGTQSGTQVSNTTSYAVITLPQGSSYVYVWAEDSVGHIGLAAYDGIIVDSLPPSLSGWSQSPTNLTDVAATDFTVTVTVSDTSLQGLPQYRYDLGGSGYSPWYDMTSIGGGQYRLTISANWTMYGDTSLIYEVNASDYFGRMAQASFTEPIEKMGVPPEFVSFTNFTVQEDSALTFTLVGYDQNSEDNLTFTASCCFTIVPMDYRRSTAYWIPTNEYVGQNYIEWNVTDGTNIIPASNIVTVIPTNDAPVLEPIPDMYGYMYQPFGAVFTATDPDNQNSYALDNDNLTFGTEQNSSWFRINSYYNNTGGNYYGIVNFTPLSSHAGYSFLGVYASDGTDMDVENFTLYIGYCGDTDVAGEPRCDSDYETCLSCPSDCGVCGSTAREGYRLTILVRPRNCLNESFIMRTYELWDRATCDNQGTIVDGFEVCGNLSDVSIKVYRYEGGEWVELEEYETDDDGRATFVPMLTGEYKLVGERRGYPDAIRYLEIWECLEESEKNKTSVAEIPPIERKPQTERPSKTDEEPEEISEESSIWAIIIYFVAVPALLVILGVSGYYYYDKEKDRAAWILKARIWAAQKRRIIIAWAKSIWKRIRDYLGY